MTPEWDWGGARWWKCDLHAHTPASEDYGHGADQTALRKRSAREWLLDHMTAGLDCVAVTDHNSGAWIDRLKDELEDLERERPDGFRPLRLFPGVEISVHGGIHILAVFGADRSTADIDTLLGAVGYEGTKGQSDGVTGKAFSRVAAIIAENGGLAIPAHVDRDKGLFQLTGETLKQALDSDDVAAMELCDPTFEKPGLYGELKLGWTEIVGSDSHHPAMRGPSHFPGSHFTWVKMGAPTIEGLRLAFLDGPLSIRRCDQDPGDPNEHGPLALESIEVVDAHYMGQAEPFAIKFNPWLNAIVGGRGTGKSTVVEFGRLALRREKDLPHALEDEFEKYRSVYPEEGPTGLLRSGTTIRVVYRKDGSRFRIQWSPVGDLDPIQEDSGGEWTRAEGDVRQRFPARLFSQKEIFHLASKPRALLNVVDEAPEVDKRSWRERIREVEAQFLSLRAKAREVESGLAEEPGLRGELDDVKRKLAVFEEAGHADVLRAFQRRRRQRRAIEVWEESWADAGERLRRVASDIVPESLDPGGFDLDSEADVELHEVASEARDRMEVLRVELENLATQADAVLYRWRKARDESSWEKGVLEAEAAYGELQEKLSEEGAGDPTAYGELVQRRQAIEQRLKELTSRKQQVIDLRTDAEERLKSLLEIRRGLTRSRKEFLDSVLQENDFVRIKVIPYGAGDTVVEEFRELIQKEGEAFEKDIGSPESGGLLGMLCPEREPQEGDNELEPAEIEQAINSIKSRVRKIAEGKYDPASLSDQRFATHLGKLQPEVLDRLDLWLPEDSLKVEYSPTGDGRNFRPIEEGSPGQKTAALLAFLLSYGNEPLILDQPEDDLDNHLIYELIVTQLREVKRGRQVIVVTHNPNIVVNGDAELVVALVARGGETKKECEGSLQARQVRNTICDVMEGGREAFDQRYRRIALEGLRAR